MDRLSKQQLNAIGIISIVIVTLMIILVIVLPIMLKTKKANDFTEKCFPTLQNTNLWAKFPGDLKSTLTHTYGVFDYKKKSNENPYEIEVKSNFSIIEEIFYDNFTKDEDTIFFNANRSYKYVEEEDKKDEKINSINMGLFEALETLAYPQLYKIGINSINYLLTRTLIDPDLFIRELFTYKLFNEMDDDIIRSEILNNLPEEKIEKILSVDDKYKNYSFKTYPGLFQWIKILGLSEEIEKSDWLSELFELTKEEISSILGNNNGYLLTEYKKYNSDLATKFNCKNEQCGIELLYIQLISGSVISSLNLEVKNYMSLNNILETQYYPFSKTPEMIYYFEEKYAKEEFSNYSPTKEQLDSLLNSESKYCLLSSNNSINFLYLNKTKEKTKQQILDLTDNQMNFLSDYFYKFLPEIFLYPPINDQKKNNLEEETMRVEPEAKIISYMFQSVADKTYKQMPKENLYDYIISTLILANLKKKTNYNELDEICPIIMQKVLDDGKKVNKICSDKNIGFNNRDSLLKWIEPYYCLSINKTDTRCNMYIIDYLKDLIYITEDEINQIFSEEYLGGAINYGIETIKNNYNCGDRCDEKDYLTKLQFWKGIVTSNATDPLQKADTIKEWFPDSMKYPVEISYYQKKYGNTDEFSEEDIDFMINLLSKNENNKYDLENSNSLAYTLNLEKKYSLYMNNKEKTSLINLVDFLIDVFIFKNENNNNDSSESLVVEYSSIKNLLEGNSEEDKIWINYLSSGNYFDNFKPNFEKTTGLDIGINLETKKQENFDFDYYGINTKNVDYDKRKFNYMNDLLTLNIKKQEYDYIENKYINLISPTYNFESLLGLRQFSDGFQYDNHLKVLYYYDTISSRPLRFLYKSEQNYKDKIKCKKYELDVEELSADLNEYLDTEKKSQKALITQKVNKPFVLSADFDNLKKYKYNKKLNEEKIENYICVDPISDMVIDSNINLIYGIYARKFGFLNKEIENEEIYPIFTYQRKYEVEVNSYEDEFPGVTEYYRNMTVFIIIGVIVIVIFAVIAALSFYYWYKKSKKSKKESMKQSLVPLSDSEFDSNRESQNNAKEINNSEKK